MSMTDVIVILLTGDGVQLVGKQHYISAALTGCDLRPCLIYPVRHSWHSRGSRII